MELLKIFNPWWVSKEWEEKDKHLREYESMKIKWFPEWIKKISLEPFSLNFVFGPRQVGKSTGIKILIKELLKSNNPLSIFYFDVEILKDLEEFRNVLLSYRKIKEENRLKTSFIFLDEVTNLREWWRIVKGFIDAGIFENDIITVTGSSTLNLLRQKESFPGRRGKGKDIEILPLSFPEFLKIKGYDLSKKELFREEFKKEFKEYLEVGGYPKSINRIEFTKDLISSLETQLMKNNKSITIFKQIISTLLEMVPSAISFNAIANKIGISNRTVENYIEDLENLYILKVAYMKENKKVNFRKEKKIFIRDPFLLNSLAKWCNKEVRKDFLYEFIVQEHLFRKFGEIYYYRDSYEIDCIAKNLKVEVKAGKPHRKYPKNVIILDEENIADFLLEL
ncbi:MAG: ATP-binding protein [Candidatus Aenigmatarchaeota archaeon]